MLLYQYCNNRQYTQIQVLLVITRRTLVGIRDHTRTIRPLLLLLLDDLCCDILILFWQHWVFVRRLHTMVQNRGTCCRKCRGSAHCIQGFYSQKRQDVSLPDLVKSRKRETECWKIESLWNFTVAPEMLVESQSYRLTFNHTPGSCDFAEICRFDVQ